MKFNEATEYLEEGIGSTLKKYFSKLRKLLGNLPIRQETDAEFKIALKAAKKMKGELGGVGVDDSNGDIYIGVAFGPKGKEHDKEFILDKNGKVKSEIEIVWNI